jgi:hypothetical protein
MADHHRRTCTESQSLGDEYHCPNRSRHGSPIDGAGRVVVVGLESVVETAGISTVVATAVVVDVAAPLDTEPLSDESDGVDAAVAVAEAPHAVSESRHTTAAPRADAPLRRVDVRTSVTGWVVISARSVANGQD